MARALAAGMAAKDVVFSGVGKTRAELAMGLDKGIGQFNLELEEEGVVLAEIARAKGLIAPATIRVNPDVDAGTHAKISTGKAENKFGLPIVRAREVYARAAKLPGIKVTGTDVHIGRQIIDLSRMETAYRILAEFVQTLRADG